MDDLAFLKQPEVRDFILASEDVDVQKLILNPPVEFKERMALIADQITSRKKLKNKFPEWLGADVILPPPISIEQASSGETASYKAGIFKGENLVDLTGGMGIDTLALSHSFQTVSYVERDAWLCRLFKYNHQCLSDKTISIYQKDAESFVNGFTGKASFYIDPGRRVQNKKVFLLEDCEPNIVELLPKLKPLAKELLIKVSPMMDITKGLQQLSHVNAVYVVSVKNECKEVLFHLNFSAPLHQPDIICVNLNGRKEGDFRFTQEQEREVVVSYSKPKKYLYDPNASILKAGAFKSVAVKFRLEKIARHTHIYTSDHFIENFPGRAFEVLQGSFKPGDLRQLLPEGRANVITKNHPLKAEGLKKKLKIKDGGGFYIIGFRDQHDQVFTALCKRNIAD